MRILAVTVAALTVLVLASGAHAAQPPKPKTFTGDEIRWYLSGWIDAATPAGWGVTSGRCIRGSKAFVCEIVSRTSTGGKRCYRAAVAFDGRFLLPLARGACTAKQRGPSS